MRPCLLLFLFALSYLAHAQPFQFRADLARVKQSGYHRISLPPAVVGRLNATLGDIRLYDGQGRETPYRLNRANGLGTTRFQSYSIVSRTSIPRQRTVLIVRPDVRQAIRSMTLLVKNASIRKTARLSGSNDGREWFGIAEPFMIDPPQNRDATTGSVDLEFPLSDYALYQLDIADSTTAPLNILQVGQYEVVNSQAGYTPIPTLTMRQTNTSTQSDLTLTFGQPARIDKLVIDVAQPSQYERQAQIGIFREIRTRRGRTEQQFEIIRSFVLRSTSNHAVLLPGIQAGELHVTINNHNSPPLTVGQVRAYQLTTSLIANLVAGTSYYLLFSDPNAQTPQYDLTAFRAAVPANLNEVGIGPVKSTETVEVSPTPFWNKQWVIWSALGLVVAVLGLLSYRMVREMA